MYRSNWITDRQTERDVLRMRKKPEFLSEGEREGGGYDILKE